MALCEKRKNGLYRRSHGLGRPHIFCAYSRITSRVANPQSVFPPFGRGTRCFQNSHCSGFAMPVAPDCLTVFIWVAFFTTDLLQQLPGAPSWGRVLSRERLTPVSIAVESAYSVLSHTTRRTRPTNDDGHSIAGWDSGAVSQSNQKPESAEKSRKTFLRGWKHEAYGWMRRDSSFGRIGSD